VWSRIADLDPSWAGRKVTLRGRVHTSRPVGKGVFLLLRQSTHSVQGVLFQSADVPKAAVKYVSSIPKESVIDIVVRAPTESPLARQRRLTLA
jgi:aspartyl/asparaginyl-tRNA synthetase